MGVQFAANAGFRTVAIARGKDKEPLARKLGAERYIDSQSQKPGSGARQIGRRQRDPGNRNGRQRDGGRDGWTGYERSVDGDWCGFIPHGFSRSNARGTSGREGVVLGAFSVRTGVRSMNEVLPLERGRNRANGLGKCAVSRGVNDGRVDRRRVHFEVAGRWPAESCDASRPVDRRSPVSPLIGHKQLTSGLLRG